MALTEDYFLLDVWAFDAKGNRIHPYKGERGAKKGLFSANFTNDTNNFEGMTEEQLIAAITSGKFRERGTIRMLPVNFNPGAERNAFVPVFFRGKHVKDY